MWLSIPSGTVALKFHPCFVCDKNRNLTHYNGFLLKKMQKDLRTMFPKGIEGHTQKIKVPVVQRVGYFIQWISQYPEKNVFKLEYIIFIG